MINQVMGKRGLAARISRRAVWVLAAAAVLMPTLGPAAPRQTRSTQRHTGPAARKRAKALAPTLPRELRIEFLSVSATNNGVEKDAPPASFVLLEYQRPGIPEATDVATLEFAPGFRHAPVPLKLKRGHDFLVAPQEVQSFEFREFWGSSDTLLPGHSRVTPVGTVFKFTVKKGEVGPRYDEIGKGNTCGWAQLMSNARAEESKIPQNPDVAGQYLFRFNSDPPVSFKIGAEHQFLGTPHPRVEISSSLDAPIHVQWDPVPGVMGYDVTARGGPRQNIQCYWTATQDRNGVEPNFFDPGMMAREVALGRLLPNTQTSCTIPAGVFHGCRNVFVDFRAYGIPTVREVRGTTVRVRNDYYLQLFP